MDFTGFAARISAPEEPNQQQPGHDTDQTHRADLPFTQLKQLQKELAPALWRNEGIESLQYQHKSDSHPQQIGAQAYFFAFDTAPAPLRMTRKNSELAGSTTITSLLLAKLDL